MKITARPTLRMLAIAAAKTLALFILLTGIGGMASLSCLKHAGDDDLDVAIMRDRQHYATDERNARRGLGWLSDWHTGRRSYDWWEEKAVAEQTILFHYHYWNPFWGTRERVNILVDRRRSRPWRSKSLWQVHPRRDYAILAMSDQANDTDLPVAW